VRRLRIDWPEAWYPVAGGALWLRPVDGLAVAPGEGLSPAARLVGGRLPRAEAHGAAWRAALRFGLAVLNAGAAVANSSVVAAAGYVQADFQSVIDKLNALLNSLRTAGIIAT
jgi:hypothetical protein